MSLGGINATNPLPANPIQQFFYSLAKNINDTFDPAPPPGTPTVGTPDPETGTVTGSLGFATGSGLTFSATQPSQGTVSVANDGTYSYTPTLEARLAAGPTTTDTFVATVRNGLSTSSVTVTVPVDPALVTIAVPSRPQGLATSPDGKRLYVASLGDNKVSVIDTATNKVIASITVGTAFPCDGQCGAFGLAVSPDGSRLYVTDSGSYPKFDTDSSIAQYVPETTVSVIDTATNTVIHAIDVVNVPGATGITAPIAVAVSPDGKRVYVGYTGGPLPVRIIDAETNTVVGETIKFFVPLALALSPDGKQLYVADLEEYVAAIDTSSNADTQLGSLSGGASAVAISPDGKRLYVTSQDWTRASLTVLDAANGAVITTVPFTRTDAGLPIQGLAVSPDGTRVYVVDAPNNRVLVVDTTTNTITGNIPVGKGPQAVVVSPDGKTLYVTNRTDNTVSVVPLANDAAPTSV